MLPRKATWFRRALIFANLGLPVATVATLFQNFACIAATAVAHLVFCWAVMNPHCGWLGPVVRRFRAIGRTLWLTIDDGPDGERTLQLATELRRRGVPATFFFIGCRAAAQPEVVRQTLALGHTVANHSATHPRELFWALPARLLRKEVEGGAAALAAFAPPPKWFRAPVGHKPLSLHAVLGASGLRLIGWTFGGRDGWHANPAPLILRLLARARPGGILLLHEARAYSVPTILAAVDALTDAGFAFTIPEDAALGD